MLVGGGGASSGGCQTSATCGGRSAFSDYYLIVLGALLVGYAILGKTVTYIGVPPLYVGEMVFALGIIAFLSTRCIIVSFASLPNLLLAIRRLLQLGRLKGVIGRWPRRTPRALRALGFGRLPP